MRHVLAVVTDNSFGRLANSSETVFGYDNQNTPMVLVLVLAGNLSIVVLCFANFCF